MRGLVWRNRVLIETVAETLTGLGNLFFYLVVEFGYVFLDQDVGAIALLATSRLSIRGSLKASTCPDAFHIVGCMKIAESIPTIFS